MHKLEKSQTENEAGGAKGATPLSFCSKNNLKKKMQCLTLLLPLLLLLLLLLIFSIIVIMIIAKHGETVLYIYITPSKTCYFKIP